MSNVACRLSIVECRISRESWSCRPWPTSNPTRQSLHLACTLPRYLVAFPEASKPTSLTMWLSNDDARVGPTTTRGTSTAASASAAQRSLGIGELLETILLFCEQADVVRFRRTNRKFLETITYSLALRQKLFLEKVEQTERVINPLAPSFFKQKKSGYRDSTIAARIDLVDAWNGSQAEVKPLWHKMMVAQPPARTCVIPTGSHTTIFFRRSYPEGMTFGDLEKAVLAAFDVRKGRNSSYERLTELSYDSSVLIYWS